MLRERRLELDLTLKHVATLAGLSLGRLARLETGGGVTPAWRAASVADVLGFPIDDLFGPALLARADVAALKNCDPHTVATAIDNGELPTDGNRVPLAAVIEWTPRVQGGQRRLGDRDCDYRRCPETFTPRHAGQHYCPGTNHGALEREARKRDELRRQAELRGFVALGRAGRQAAQRYGLKLVPLNLDGYGVTPVGLPASQLPRFEESRERARWAQLEALRPRQDQVREEHRIAAEAQRAYCEANDLWTLPRAADEVPCSIPFLEYLIARGRLKIAECVDFGVGERRLLRAVDVKAATRAVRKIERDWYGWALSRGEPSESARRIAERAARRIENRKRSRAGNAKPSPMREHHERWRAMFQDRLDDDGGYGYDWAEERPRKRQDVLEDIWLEDREAHPEAFADMPDVDAVTRRRACAVIDRALRRGS